MNDYGSMGSVGTWTTSVVRYRELKASGRSFACDFSLLGAVVIPSKLYLRAKDRYIRTQINRRRQNHAESNSIKQDSTDHQSDKHSKRPDVVK